MRRASSSRARRTPTTSASSTCVSLYAREWRQRSRPLSCSTCCSRAVRTCGITTWRARAHCSTSWPRCSGRMPSADDLRREIARANAARAAARRLVALRRIVPRVTGTRGLPVARGILGDGTGSLRGDGTRCCEQDRGAPAARRPTRAAHWSACGWPDTARGHRIARRRRRCRSRPVGKRRRGRRRAHRRRPGCRARRQVSSRLDRCAHTRATRCAAGRRACWTTSMPSSCRCRRTTRCSVGTIRRCATC